MHEHLFLGICLPYSPYPPYSLRGTPKLLALYRKLQQVFQQDKLDGGDILHELLSLNRRCNTLPELLVRNMLYIKQHC